MGRESNRATGYTTKENRRWKKTSKKMKTAVRERKWQILYRMLGKSRGEGGEKVRKKGGRKHAEIQRGRNMKECIKKRLVVFCFFFKGERERKQKQRLTEAQRQQKSVKKNWLWEQHSQKYSPCIENLVHVQRSDTSTCKQIEAITAV